MCPSSIDSGEGSSVHQFGKREEGRDATLSVGLTAVTPPVCPSSAGTLLRMVNPCALAVFGQKRKRIVKALRHVF